MTETPTHHSSFRRKRSGAAKSHSPMAGSIAEGDLSTQRFNSPEVFIPIPPCPSARDDGGSRRHTVISKGDTNARNTALPCRHFDRSEAEWRNLTPKCGKPMVAGDLSAQSLHREEYLSLMTAGSPAGDDEAAGSISLYESHKKEALKKYFTFLQSLFIL